MKLPDTLRPLQDSFDYLCTHMQHPMDATLLYSLVLAAESTGRAVQAKEEYDHFMGVRHDRLAFS